MVSKQILKSVILDFQQRILDIPLIQRELHIDNALNYVFVGLRRAGKSYSLFQNIQQRIRSGENVMQDVLYVNFEDDRLYDFDVADFQMLLNCYYELFPERTPVVYLDEIQLIEGWEKFARRLADQKYRVYITGSNAKMLGREIATTLGGRFVTREVYPFSFAEYLEFKGVKLEENWRFSQNLLQKIRFLFDDYFYFGGFAENLNSENKREWLNVLLKKILLGDIVMRNNIRESSNIQLLVRKLAESVMQPSSQNHLCNVLKSSGAKITRNTVADYLDNLQDAYLTFQMKNYTDKFVERVMNSKHYFSDNGLLSVCLSDPDTKLLENLVAISLWKKHGGYMSEEVFYYNKNIEVDFYVPSQSMAVQVSFSIQDYATRKREIEALHVMNEAYKTDKNLIITFDEEEMIEENGLQIEVVPIWKWLLNY